MRSSSVSAATPLCTVISSPTNLVRGPSRTWADWSPILRERDPAHYAYINLFPTYANNKQLGTEGDTVTAYREHLRQYVEIVRPALISYDHYQFSTSGDNDQYFLNLALIRQTSQAAGLPFLNIVQACTWTPSMRVPGSDEMRYLVYTTLAYGAQGISYYVYCWPGHTGGIAQADGTPTPIYHALKSLNREFTAIAGQLQSVRSLGVYHLGMAPPGSVRLPSDAVFRVEPAVPDMEYRVPERVRGLLLGIFGQPEKPTHVVVVNLDYLSEFETTLVGSGNLELFDATTSVWQPVGASRTELKLAPGGGACCDSHAKEWLRNNFLV